MKDFSAANYLLITPGHFSADWLSNDILLQIHFRFSLCVCVCVYVCSPTLQLHKVGTQPAASSHAVTEVVEGEEVGWDGPGVSGLRLQLLDCDRLAQIHTSRTGNLQHRIKQTHIE